MVDAPCTKYVTELLNLVIIRNFILLITDRELEW